MSDKVLSTWVDPETADRVRRASENVLMTRSRLLNYMVLYCLARLDSAEDADDFLEEMLSAVQD